MGLRQARGQLFGRLPPAVNRWTSSGQLVAQEPGRPTPVVQNQKIFPDLCIIDDPGARAAPPPRRGGVGFSTKQPEGLKPGSPTTRPQPEGL
jgi:hypothetical protein